MGVILSCIGIVSKPIKDRRDRKKADKIVENYGPQGVDRERPQQEREAGHGKKQQSFPPSPELIEEGLRVEHLASVPPPTSAQLQARGEAGKGNSGQVGGGPAVGVAAPTLPSTTPKITSTSTSTHGSSGKDKMASDEDYASFLDKANEDPSSGTAKTQGANKGKGKVELKATDKGAKVPAVLKKATNDAFYVSDADEPFVPVVLKFDGSKLPDEATFAKLVNHPSPDDAEISIMDISEWDPQGQYKDVVEATREASKGSDVRVYRVESEGARVEYWVVGIEGGKIVGAKALAVES